MGVDVMSLHIVHYPAAVLRQRAAPVSEVTPEVRAVAARMVELMHEARGIGLAAPQVGLPWRLFVAHVPPTGPDDEPGEEPRVLGELPATATEGPVVYINPRLSGFSRDLVAASEGCLSIPGITGDVRRPSTVTLEALDLEGKPFAVQARGLLARCWQHEFDHLEGVLCIDKFLPPDRRRAAKQLTAMEQAAGHLKAAARG